MSPLLTTPEESVVNLTLPEYFEYSRLLQDHHDLFYKFWEMGCPTFTNSVATACVAFNDEGAFTEFRFNPKYWADRDKTQRAFVIAHEALHVILDHGTRMIGAIQQKNANAMKACNLAMDVVVNHMLIEKFGFDRAHCDPDNNLIWQDTLFNNHPDRKNIKLDQHFEYYFNLIYSDMNMKDQVFGEGKGGEAYPGEGSLDSHDQLPQTSHDSAVRREVQKAVDGIEAGKRQDLADKLQADLDKNLTSKPEEAAGDGDQPGGTKAGTGAGGGVVIIPPFKRKLKNKWETVIKRWVLKSNRDDYETVESWMDPNRRTQAILPTNVRLPSEHDKEIPVMGRIPVYFFLDTSGSCIGLASRFWKAARSLPPNRFKISMFCFDTFVYPVDIKKSQVRGGGGTSFTIMENQIQSDIRSGVINRYPEAVFVISDGFGNVIAPEKPRNWYWFLTPHHSETCIPKASKKLLLENYE